MTDATAMDESGQFWVSNYFFPGDRILKPEQDPLELAFGLGPTHAGQETVERILGLLYDGERITLTGAPPTLIALEAEGRNWEAIVRLEDRRFLAITDGFPATILGFIPAP